MKIIISENQYRLLIEGVSRKDVLVSKFGLSEDIAEIFDEVCGKLSILIVKKYLEYFLEQFYDDSLRYIKSLDWKVELTKSEIDESITDYIKSRLNITLQNKKRALKSELEKIMLYIKIELNGNFSSLNKLNIDQIYSLALNWYSSSEISKGLLNYVEKNPILIDFRNEKGEGYYWVNLGYESSTEECERMNHCGKSVYGNLYSLRSDKKITKTDTLNQSHLTAAIGKNGKLFQLKGYQNRKPTKGYHKYILPLFDIYEYGKFLITGFGEESKPENDFKLSDLSDDDFNTLKYKRPDLF